VNDIVIINGTGGLVEEVNLRTTVLRGLDGTVHIFPNGAITSLSNKTHEFSYYVSDVGVAYKEDTDRVVDVLRQIGDELRRSPEYGPLILDALDVLGVDQFADSSVIIKVRIKTLPSKQWQVGREMNRRIKKRFEKEGIEIPFPHRSLYFGEASRPFRLDIDSPTRDQLKTIIREVLSEEPSGDGLQKVRH
jgi:small conductance mechanosensitive channel